MDLIAFLRLNCPIRWVVVKPEGDRSLVGSDAGISMWPTWCGFFKNANHFATICHVVNMNDSDKILDLDNYMTYSNERRKGAFNHNEWIVFSRDIGASLEF